MFLERHFKIGRVFGTAVLLSFALRPAVSVSQDVATSTELLAEQSPSEPIEEIIVYGDKTLLQWRLEMWAAQEKVFLAWNELNTDDEFDVHCYRDALPKSGSRVKRPYCKANFVDYAQYREAQGFILGQPHDSSSAVIKRKHKELIEILDKSIAENPELREAVIEYGTTVLDLEAARKEKCDGRIIACRK